MGKKERLEHIEKYLGEVCYENIEPMYFNAFFEKDNVERLKSVVGKVHIVTISSFRTGVEKGFAGYAKAQEYLGSEIPLTGEKEFLEKYVNDVGENYTRAQNMSRHKLLGNMVRSWKKVSFKAMTGGFKEETSSKIEQERSFLLISRPDVSFEEFKKVMIGLGVIFGQDSILLKEAGKEFNLVTTNYSGVVSEKGKEVDNGKYKFFISRDSIGENEANPKFKNTLTKILDTIENTAYAYSIFDKLGKRLDNPDAESIGDDGKVKNRVWSADVDFEESVEPYPVGHWKFYVANGKTFDSLSEKYSHQSVERFINFSKIW